MWGLRQPLNHTISFIVVASMKEVLFKQKPHAAAMKLLAANMMANIKTMMLRQWIAAKMENAPWKAMIVKTAAKRRLQKWIVAKMENAPWKAMMVKIAAKRLLQKWIAVKMENAPWRAMMVKTVAKNQKINSLK
jgi:hypothetical protein